MTPVEVTTISRHVFGLRNDLGQPSYQFFKFRDQSTIFSHMHNSIAGAVTNEAGFNYFGLEFPGDTESRSS